MRKFFRKLCCCLRPQTCKKVDDGTTINASSVANENGQSHPQQQRRPAAGSIKGSPPSSIITQVSKDSPGINVSGQPKNPVLANPRASVRAAGAPSPKEAEDPTKSPYAAGFHHDYYATEFVKGPDGTVIKRPRLSVENGGNYLLPPRHPIDHRKKCLVIDLDETLVHSSFKPVKNADFIIPVEIDNVVHQVHVLKRPYADEFLQRCGELFECVLFTASLDMYADPVADLLDKRGVFRARLFREACVFQDGNYVKDLRRLGRDLDKVIIVDNSPISYAFHPENAIAVSSWFDNPNDSELLDIIPLLEELSETEDIYQVLNRKYKNPPPLVYSPMNSKELYG